jgi:hypothetical protein
MARLEYFIVCRSVAVDIDTDEITLANVLEDVFLEESPTYVLPRIVAVSSWELSAEEMGGAFQAMLGVVLPGGKPVRFPMNLARGRLRYRAIQGVLNIPLDQPGKLAFEVQLNGDHSAWHYVTVHPAAVRRKNESNDPGAVGPATSTTGPVPG